MMTEETRAIVVREMDAMELPDVDALKQGLATVRKFQEVVRTLMIEGHDYGTIPGTPKPTLLKPGAEKIAKILGLADTYEIVSETEDWQKPFFAYKVRCYLRRFGSESVVSTGLGECNSMETKYRWRWVWPDAVPDAQKGGLVFRTVKGGGKQYRLENDQIYDQVNTILKMAKKRALVDAALSAGRLSDVFTQDIEDFAGRIQSEAEAKTAQEGAVAPETPGAPQTTGAGGKTLVEGRGNCPVHNIPFAHKTGIAKTGKNAGKPFDFWACPAPKDEKGNYCKEQPPKRDASPSPDLETLFDDPTPDSEKPWAMSVENKANLVAVLETLSHTIVSYDALRKQNGSAPLAKLSDFEAQAVIAALKRHAEKQKEANP